MLIHPRIQQYLLTTYQVPGIVPIAEEQQRAKSLPYTTYIQWGPYTKHHHLAKSVNLETSVSPTEGMVIRISLSFRAALHTRTFCDDENVVYTVQYLWLVQLSFYFF